MLCNDEILSLQIDSTFCVHDTVQFENIEPSADQSKVDVKILVINIFLQISKSITEVTKHYLNLYDVTSIR